MLSADKYPAEITETDEWDTIQANSSYISQYLLTHWGLKQKVNILHF